LVPENGRGRISGVSTDTRTLSRGELFVPLRGPRFDGHHFIEEAVRRGAAACLSEEPVSGVSVPVIRVVDTLRALGDLAAVLRNAFSGPVIAITGSSGKTTTKEMLATILDLTGPGLKTEGNLNNLIGLPLTLFRIEDRHQWMVLEMGMSARREIARLSEIGSPTVGVITNVGMAHLETLHTMEGIAMAKGELFAALQPGTTAVINGEDPRVALLPVANGVRRLVFGLGPEAEVRAEQIVSEGGRASFRLVLPSGGRKVALRAVGRHQVLNALAAAAAAVALGVEEETIALGLEKFQVSAGRSELIQLPCGAALLEDSYNANPQSVRAALDTLDDLPGKGQRIAVLGDMLELGTASVSLHREIGAFAAKKTDLLLLLGDHSEDTASGARAAGMSEGQVRIFRTHEEAAACLKRELNSGDRVLVKGSRGMRMEKINLCLHDPNACRAAGNG